MSMGCTLTGCSSFIRLGRPEKGWGQGTQGHGAITKQKHFTDLAIALVVDLDHHESDSKAHRGRERLASSSSPSPSSSSSDMAPHFCTSTFVLEAEISCRDDDRDLHQDRHQSQRDFPCSSIQFSLANQHQHQHQHQRSFPRGRLSHSHLQTLTPGCCMLADGPAALLCPPGAHTSNI